jgi:hypothetical protein
VTDTKIEPARYHEALAEYVRTVAFQAFSRGFSAGEMHTHFAKGENRYEADYALREKEAGFYTASGFDEEWVAKYAPALGFTREDVKALREAIEVIDGEWGMNAPNDDGGTTHCLPAWMEDWKLASIADRIESLLPPEKEIG